MSPPHLRRNPCQKATGTSPTEVVDHFIADICRKDLDAAMSHVAQDCYYDNVPIGDMNTRDEMRDFLNPDAGRRRSR